MCRLPFIIKTVYLYHLIAKVANVNCIINENTARLQLAFSDLNATVFTVHHMCGAVFIVNQVCPSINLEKWYNKRSLR